jgi:hypothetical protein
MPAGSNQVVSEFYPLKRREIRAQFDGRASTSESKSLGGEVLTVGHKQYRNECRQA